MRSPQNVLESLSSKACNSNYRYQRLYRNLYNPEFYLIAYQKIQAKQGNMTAGTDGKTVDGIGMKRINALIARLKDFSYQPAPARRTYIPKANGKKRPLGIPSFDDKLVQEVVRMILESIYEPTFLNTSHGFRPKRSCHTALQHVQKNFTGVKWFVEGDIKGCFDHVDHHALVNILRRRIQDEHFIGLIWKFLKAGYMENWVYHNTYSGTPQGSICPDGIEKHSDYLKLGDRYCRVLFLKDYANYIQDEIVTNLTDLDRNMMLSIDILNVPTDEAVREVENRLLGVETNITNWQRRQNQNNNFSAIVPYDMELQRRESKEFLADLTTRDQRMMQAVLTLVITADTKQQLDTDTEKIRSLSRRCQLAVLKYQQIDGLNTVLPIGTRKINAFRTLTTESLAVFMPFKVQEIMDRGGIYFGENAISHNLIMCNKANLLNQSSFRLGVPGSGKSFSVKEEIVFLILNTDDDILIADPEGEYAPLIEAMDGVGSVIRVAAGGKDRLNAMYMVDGYGENNPIVVKSQFIMSLVERIDPKGVGPQHNSIIDRCTGAVYEEAEQNGTIPTLATLREKLMEQPEEEAREIALALELFTTGSLDIFGHGSTVDLDKRVVVFDIHGLGEQLKPIGHLVITDTMLNRVTLNWKKGRRTHVFIDEFHVMFENEFSAAFFNSAWRQFRKRNAYPTAITQNVEYLLDSVQASTMLSNSEFIVMLNQAAGDREKLAHLLNISEEQMSYITNADAGCGLIKYGSALVPFVNRFPDNTELYRLMTTRPGEGRFSEGRA